MSGHSKWHQIKHKKEAVDQKRGALFSKLLRVISVASRGNPDPQFNPRLRTFIEKARAANVPNENIERAISRSTEEKNLEEVTVEAYGPESAGIIIEGITDSKNRTIAEIKIILSEHGAKMADQGSVLWSFERAGGGWRPKFPRAVSEEARRDILGLVEALESHDDIQNVVTDARPENQNS